jgi:hypothetical protein
MGAAEVVSVTGAAVVVVMNSVVPDVTIVSRVADEWMISTESVEVANVTEANDVVVPTDVAVSIDGTGNVAVDASEMAVDDIGAEPSSSVNQFPLKEMIKCITHLACRDSQPQTQQPSG